MFRRAFLSLIPPVVGDGVLSAYTTGQFHSRRPDDLIALPADELDRVDWHPDLASAWNNEPDVSRYEKIRFIGDRHDAERQFIILADRIGYELHGVRVRLDALIAPLPSNRPSRAQQFHVLLDSEAVPSKMQKVIFDSARRLLSDRFEDFNPPAGSQWVIRAMVMVNENRV